jgi:hypothetical protein
MDKAPLRYRFDELKPYTLEVYGPDNPEHLLWKRDSDQPFTPMARGDRLQLPDAPDARFDEPFRIADIEHVIWTHGEAVRFVTRLTVERA